jgi:hypothetical protein
MGNFQNSLRNGSAPLSSTFDVTLTAADAKGNTLSQTVYFEMRKENKPVSAYTLEVTGDGIASRKELLESKNTQGESGYDPDRVAVNIAASLGIKTFLVKIESTSNQFNGLVGMTGLADFSLSHPTEVQAERLGQLSLPYGDQVIGQTEMPFDISTFVPMLIGSGGGVNFDADFILTVTDAQDHEIVERIKVAIVYDL